MPTAPLESVPTHKTENPPAPPMTSECSIVDTTTLRADKILPILMPNAVNPFPRPAALPIFILATYPPAYLPPVTEYLL